MILKQPLDYQQQLNKLISHGISVSNSKKEIEILKQVNYYRFIGYALQFRAKTNGSTYIDKTSFEKIYFLYIFDEKLRDLFRRYLEKVEIFYRTQIAYGFSMQKCLQPPYDQHYDRNNFYNKEDYDKLSDSFKREKNYYKDSLIVKHHKNKYGNKMPLWVMVELISFSNLSKLYSCMYFSEKKAISKEIGISEATLENHLHCLSVFRNKCAHAARLYSTEFNPPTKFNSSFLRKNKNVKNNSLFAYVLVLLKRLPDEESRKNLTEEIQKLIEDSKNNIDMSLIGFPSNYMDILSNNLS